MTKRNFVSLISKIVKKKGLSSIIGTVLIVVLGLIGIALFWSVINRTLDDSTSSGKTNAKKLEILSQTSISIEGVKILDGNLILTIKNLGSKDIVGFRAIVTSNISENLESSDKLASLERKEITFQGISSLVSEIKLIEVIPLVSIDDKNVYLTEAKTKRIINNPDEINVQRTFKYLSNGMNFESLDFLSNPIVIKTTGAQYEVNGTGIKMWRRIDPKTNSIKPRLVSKIEFSENLGDFKLVSSNTGEVILNNSNATLTFYSDSLFLINASSSFTYIHRNLIINSPWNKSFGSENRMWTDGYGGSLHGNVSGPTSTIANQEFTTFSVNPGDVTAHMVYPSKAYNFERLYGANAKPFVHFLYSENSMRTAITNVNDYVTNGFGVMALFAIYNTTTTGTTDQNYASSPEYLANLDVMGYEFSNETLTREFISTMHSKGIKVITYMTSPYPFYYKNRWKYPNNHPTMEGKTQPINITLDWMRGFQKEFNLDGWYFDNSDAGLNMMDDYNFIRQVRTDIGEKGIIYNHDSGDVWGTNREGLRAIFVDNYVDYTLTGEHGPLAPIDEPNDTYLRFYSSGYGMSQAYGMHKRISSGIGAISEGEKARAMGQNYNSIERTKNNDWLVNFKPAYDYRKNQYLSGNFDPDVNLTFSWFKTPSNIVLTPIDSSTVQVTWDTPVLATSRIYWDNNSVWWMGEGQNESSDLVKNHNLTAHLADPTSKYKFRIRSSNNLPGLNEIIWGKVVSQN